MANALRGEVAFEAQGKSHTLRFSANALCELEDKLDKSTGEIVAMLQDGARMRMTTVRALVWAGLREAEPEITLEQAGKLITVFGFKEIMAKVGEAFQQAFPDDGEGDGQRPQKPGQSPPGTGPGSKSRS